MCHASCAIDDKVYHAISDVQRLSLIVNWKLAPAEKEQMQQNNKTTHRNRGKECETTPISFQIKIFRQWTRTHQQSPNWISFAMCHSEMQFKKTKTKTKTSDKNQKYVKCKHSHCNHAVT
jgi:hypothetical protein